jgi:hypothetical protein
MSKDAIWLYDVTRVTRCTNEMFHQLSGRKKSSEKKHKKNRQTFTDGFLSNR